MCRSALHMLLAALATINAGGCYLHHGRGHDPGSDATVTADAAVRDGDVSGDAAWDGGDAEIPSPDGAIGDATVDSALDAEVDAGPTHACIVPDDYPTLQAALDDPLCDPIRVRGTAWQLAPAGIHRDVTITSLGPESVATLRGVGNGSVVSIDAGRRVTLERLAVTGGLAHQGGGIHSEGHLTLRETWIGNNRAVISDVPGTTGAWGAGIWQRGGSITLEVHNVFENNQCDSENSVAMGGAMHLDRTTLVGTGMLIVHGNLAVGTTGAGGGAIASVQSTVRAANVRMRNNEAAATGEGSHAGGGAIYIEGGEWSLNNFDLSENTARAQAPGGLAAQAEGGAISCRSGSLDLNDGLASGNQAIALIDGRDTTAASIGGFLSGGLCSVTLRDMSIGGNRAEASGTDSRALAFGGGVACAGANPFEIARVTMNGNTARIRLEGTAATGGEASEARGGAVLALGCQMSIADSLLEGNGAEIEAVDPRGDGDVACGGGVAAEGGDGAPVVDIARTTFLHNEATANPIDGAVSVRGGAVCVTNTRPGTGLDLNLTNSTLAANGAHVDPGAPSATARGGGLDVTLASPDNVHVSLFNVTVTLNSAIARHPLGSAIHQQRSQHDVIRTRNSIIWNNPSEPGFDAGECVNPPLSHGNNFLATDCESILNNDDHVADPGMLPVTTCGERCRILPLTPQSGALNNGNPNGCTGPGGSALIVDQRGQPRSDRCDVGAFEL